MTLIYREYYLSSMGNEHYNACDGKCIELDILNIISYL